MSHFTRIKTQLRDLDKVEQALADLGYEVERGTRAVRGYMDQKARADLVVRTESAYDIGFRLEHGMVVMVADLWGLQMDRQQFLDQLTQQYAYIVVRAKAEEQGWQLATEETQEDGSIRLVMQRWP